MICKICGSDTRLIYDKQFDINYYNCPKCEFIQMEDQAIISFDKERAVYDLHENSFENEGYVNMFREFLNRGVVPFKEEGKLLDFGSGPEPVLVKLIEKEYEYEVVYYDLHYQPEKIYEGKVFDVITSTEVVEHLSDPMTVFELFHNLLDKGGIISFMTLLHNNDPEWFLKWWYRRDETHTSFFTEETIAYIAKEIGFDKIPDESLEGPVGVAFSKEDEISAAKIIHEFSKKNENLKLRAALFEGRVLTLEETKQLAMLPGKEELLSKLVFLLNSPIQGFHSVLNNTITGFVRVLDAIKEKQEQTN
jgi:SAM-dependent methyltransferase